MKITLCGSTRFTDQYIAWNRYLTLRGHVVYSVAGSAKHGWEITDDGKETLDLVHLLKILNSDTILVINCLLLPEDATLPRADRTVAVGAMYTGVSTKREIKWAKMLSKKVKYTSSTGGSDF